MPAQKKTPLTLTSRFEEEESGTLRDVPFEVPKGVDQFRMTISYNDQIDSIPTVSGGNTLDIGLFDQQGTETGGPGFRGWSGSNKLDIVIGKNWSTPPYAAGAIKPGTWNLLLGAYKVGPNGLDVEVGIDFSPDVKAPGKPVVPDIESLERADLPAAGERNWFRGDLHAHSVYSDGSATPAELVVRAYESGLDFIGITDHNRAQAPTDLVPTGDDWPVLVPGVEVTTYAGHFNVWGTDTWYDFRDASPEGVQASIDAANADGGLVSINHPKPFGPDWAYGRDIKGFQTVEVWNGWWDRLNNVSLKVWEDALRRGERIVGVSGSDVHHLDEASTPDNPLSPARLGWPTLWVQAKKPLTAEAILAAIRAGRCFMSDSPSGPQIYLSREDYAVSARVVGGSGTALALVGASGIIATEAVTSDDQTWSFAINVLGKGQTYVRAQIHGEHGGFRALSNPIWLKDPDPNSGS
ncbi:MAG: CehA/McbA family metallohydrolase [Chloroflexota bacterium]|nr:CehA/McbA family metallohydrolase [Chloroflexota bacterium]